MPNGSALLSVPWSGSKGAVIPKPAVPTAIAGVDGMNFKNMPELELPFGYPVELVVIFALCGYLYSRFKRTEWL